MALLKLETRKKYFKALGLGEYNERNIKAFQKKYLRAKDVDGIYGIDTDNLLRHVYNCSLVKNFKPEEFKCECGGRYCTGYPSYMKKVELKNLQRIRDHFGRPMTVTCGLRCRPYNNSLRGSITNSKHLSGYATDFYMSGVTDTLANRKAAIRWIKKLPNHGYTYGNGINSNGVAVAAGYMGNALHTDTNKPVAVTTAAKVKKSTKAKSKKQDKIVAFAKKIAADNSWHYVHWKKDDPKTKECPICHKHPKGKYHGTYCTIFPVMCWHHGGGIKMKCGNCLNNGLVDKIYNAKTKAEATRLARKYLGVKDIEVIRSKSGIAKKALKAGDMCYYFKGSTCQHAFLYIGNGKMIDANSYKDVKKQIAIRKAMSCKVAIRYVGK
jgi:hypothetical protein